MNAASTAAPTAASTAAASIPAPAAPLVRVVGLTMAFGDEVVQRNLDFDIRRDEVLAIVGASGCGKSTLLRHLIGLQEPAAGQVLYGDQDLHRADDETLASLRRSFGVMFQAGALWSSMTVGENVMLPLRLFSHKPAAERARIARWKLALVGLEGAFELEPAELSGGMRKRAAIARALALDPQLLYLDEPSSGLDPFSAARLDGLILNLRRNLGTTVVMVSHSIESVFAVADRLLYLDHVEKTMTALDAPRVLAETGPERVRAFLHRRSQP
ncbi:MAG TPA: ATP-binding cassette domain-containing protein [Rubrivivax sp.]|nr:ATP-binding cassette domain-containing protein [Rubrivivax sp.]